VLRRGILVPPWSTFPWAPLSSRTVGFPESGWQRRLSPEDLPGAPEAQALARVHPLRRRLYFQLGVRGSSSLSGSVSRRCSRATPATYREPLCPPMGVTLDGAGSSPPQPALPGLHRSYRLMRRTNFLRAALLVGSSARSLQVAASPCWKMVLPDVISTIFVWALGPVPRCAPSVLVPVSSRGTSASPQFRRGFGAQDIPRRGFCVGGAFRGCSHSVRFRLPHLLDPLTAPTTASFRRAAGPFTPRNGRAVTRPNCGIATCLNRVTDTAGLSPARSWPCRPLH